MSTVALQSPRYRSPTREQSCNSDDSDMSCCSSPIPAEVLDYDPMTIQKELEPIDINPASYLLQFRHRPSDLKRKAESAVPVLEQRPQKVIKVNHRTNNTLSSSSFTPSEDRPFKCTVEGCGASFNHSSNLTRHNKTHTGEKPYKCPFKGCKAAFAQSSDVTKHTRTHTGEKPFKCSFAGCSAAFADSSNLTRHTKIHSVDRQNNQVRCANQTSPVAHNSRIVVDAVPLDVYPMPSFVIPFGMYQPQLQLSPRGNLPPFVPSF